MSKPKKTDFVHATFALDADDRDWDTMPAKLSIVASPRDLLQLIKQLADAASRDDGDTVQLELTGSLYMTGRLPPKATFTEDGRPAPGIVIVDEVTGWDFPPKRRSR
jgi:hypothetical protein